MSLRPPNVAPAGEISTPPYGGGYPPGAPPFPRGAQRQNPARGARGAPTFIRAMAYDCQPENAFREAKALLCLLKNKGETIAAVRSTIKPSTSECNQAMNFYRRQVLLCFDALTIRPCQPATITDELRDEILRLLKMNWSQERVAKTLRVGLLIVKRCAIPARASTWKAGRGRRFTPETIAKIKQAIVTEKTSRKVERIFQIDNQTVQKLRREMGDFEDRRHRKKLNAEQLEQARLQVASGARWLDVAQAFNVAPSTLMANVTYRKRASFRKFSTEEERTILHLVKRGVGKRTIARRFARPRSSIYWLIQRTNQAKRVGQ